MRTHSLRGVSLKRLFVIFVCCSIIGFTVFLISLRQSKSIRNDVFASTPPMGWNGWNAFRCGNANEQLIKEAADALVSSGMRDVGYSHVIIDDCWQGVRDNTGTIQPDLARFPHGMKAVADYVHAKGLKFGIYTSAGTHTCEGRPGSLGYEQQDANTYASWGVDYVKVDWCGVDNLDALEQYSLWRDALAKTGRPMLLSIAIANKGEEKPWLWGQNTGQLWRVNDDIWDSWERMISIADINEPLAKYAGPGHWNDPDMLEVGNGGMTLDEYRTHMSLWAIMAAPLIAGNDLTKTSLEVIGILTNPEIIAIDQDIAGIQGKRVVVEEGREIWVKPLTSGTQAVALVNRNASEMQMIVSFADLGFFPLVFVRDVWERMNRGFFWGSYIATVPPHGTVVLKLSGFNLRYQEKSTLPFFSVVSGYLSDQAWVNAINGHGPVERDRANGEKEPQDGMAMSLRGTAYRKGLGVHAYSDIQYYTAGQCQVFSADVGIDDEAVDKKAGVIFLVYLDGRKAYKSSVLDGFSRPARIRLDVSESKILNLRVASSSTENNHYRHADWANAKIYCTN